MYQLIFFSGVSSSVSVCASFFLSFWFCRRYRHRHDRLLLFLALNLWCICVFVFSRFTWLVIYCLFVCVIFDILFCLVSGTWQWMMYRLCVNMCVFSVIGFMEAHIFGLFAQVLTLFNANYIRLFRTTIWYIMRRAYNQFHSPRNCIFLINFVCILKVSRICVRFARAAAATFTKLGKWHTKTLVDFIEYDWISFHFSSVQFKQNESRFFL